MFCEAGAFEYDATDDDQKVFKWNDVADILKNDGHVFYLEGEAGEENEGHHHEEHGEHHCLLLSF